MNPTDFMSAFLEELDEQLVQMEQKIINLEELGGDRDTVQDLFRVAHTLKGSCAAMGFNDMKELTHAMEHVLDEVRNQRLSVSDNMTEILFRCFDGLQDFKEGVVEGRESTVDIAGLINELQGFLEDSHTVYPNLSRGDGQDETKMVLTSEARLKAIEATKQGLHLYDVVFVFNSDSVMRGVRAYLAVDTLKEIGELIQVTPSLEALEELEDAEVREFHAMLSTNAGAAQIQKVVATNEFQRVVVSEVGEGLQAADVSTPLQRADETATVPARKSHSVRVDVEQLETLMNLVGELVIDQARIEQVNRTLGKKYKSDEEVLTLGDISAHVSRVVNELQENIMMARMLPIESLFDRFPRVVRDLAHTLNKDVHLSLEGKDTRLDRTVIEEIADPLIHLIRNAVDHGLEPAEIRSQAGKPVQGTLRLTASHEDNKVVITVEDDGAGIDADRIRRSALSKGVVTAEEAEKLTEMETLHLIFRPGFSTAETVSDVSGRGVGMDIVRDHIERLSGTIEIETVLGKGTTFRITLPLTLAIIPGLLVGVSDQTFVIPVSNVFEIVRIQPDGIQSVHGRPTILLRGQATPVLYLHQYFGLVPSSQNKKHLPVVVVGTGDKRFAIVVDELHGNQEIVKKALANRTGPPSGISGATILGDGLVGLILDIAEIARDHDRTGRRS